ncbi:ABC transporter substrate-binding protein [Streptomyces sp. V4-01]|uniref:ABC transporter substrate-binding protein n=1 Tax=Actinacidiphila polyblastidii TaxID=3110430 RepID=A0ABU7PDK6_9ACTN|nr:ABC transporter substrate-binding protein [Streptomyces sp. V4-01]
MAFEEPGRRTRRPEESARPEKSGACEPTGNAWEFTDDRGVRVSGGSRRSPRIVAYVRAGAALDAYGLTPVAVYGSGHDSATVPDPAKAGSLGPTVGYLGVGARLDAAGLAALAPDLLVDVTYDGRTPYAVGEEPATAAEVPLAVLGVGAGTTLEGIVGRFAALAAALGGSARGAAGEWAAARRELGAAVAGAARPPRVLVLSAAGPEQVHIARPDAWPELCHLAALGVDLVRPLPASGVNWLTTDWEHALTLGAGADLVLADSRAHATAPAVLAALPAWQRLTAAATVLPWNPELPPAPGACAHFLREVAAAVGVR